MPDKINHVAKDSVFRSLFSEPQNLLKLYQALHPEDDKVTEQDLHIVTMEQIFFKGIYNDLGFLAGDKMLIMAEAQSTWSPNIVLRELIYLIDTYQEYLTGIGANLYGSKPVKIPKPEMYVIYTKERDNRPEWLSFKDTFFPDEVDCSLDARAKVLYADDSDSIVNQYIRFCMVFDQQRGLHGNTQQAIMETIRICCADNLLKDFLTRRRTEVEGIMGTLFNQDYIDELNNKQIREEGELARAFKVALNLLKMKLHLEDIVKATELSADEVRRLAKENGLSVV